ncbi:MAG TPA: hypothetical protein VMJ10_37330 [Kofleriaceae bacterium]|nr:hypothetical protein [Kofleriaceae bacterium]
MEERKACALLKARFEAAGFHIAENVMFEEDGMRFEMDGFDADARVGYEYVTDEAGDSWDVDDAVQQALAERRVKGDLFVLVVNETEAPDADALGKRADAFLAELPKHDDDDGKDDKPKPRAKRATSSSAKKPAAKKAKK